MLILPFMIVSCSVTKNYLSSSPAAWHCKPNLQFFATILLATSTRRQKITIARMSSNQVCLARLALLTATFNLLIYDTLSIKSFTIPHLGQRAQNGTLAHIHWQEILMQLKNEKLRSSPLGVPCPTMQSLRGNIWILGTERNLLLKQKLNIHWLRHCFFCLLTFKFGCLFRKGPVKCLPYKRKR